MSDQQTDEKPKTTMSALRDNRYVAAFVLIAAIVGGLAKFSDDVDKLLVKVGFRSDALSLTQPGGRDELSREITREAWRRFFWARAYLTRVKSNAAIAEQDDAWHKYIDATAEWSSNIMIFILGVDRYYGYEKSAELENKLQNDFNAINDALRAVRYKKPNVSPNELESNLAFAYSAVDNANVDFYRFVSAFEKGQRR